MSGEHEAREPHALERAAQRYAQEYPWVNEATVELSLLIIADSAAQSAALSRFYRKHGFGRTHGRYGALRVLYFTEGHRLSQNEMRAELGVTSPAVTYLIDGLEKDGLVRRVPSPDDRRVLDVELTEEGLTLCKRLVPGVATFMAEMSRGFSAEEMSLFRDFLRRFNDNASSSYQGAQDFQNGQPFEEVRGEG